MYAEVNRAKSIHVPLRYNEQKVEEGKAQCIYAANFMKDADQLTYKDKVFHFERLNTLNEKIGEPMAHISLNFHSSQLLSDVEMKDISREFMQKMGLDDQPYLVYRHEDAAHPHCHIVTTRIQDDGAVHYLSLGDMHHAKEVTQELEEKWGLRRSLRHEEEMPLGAAEKIVYGEKPTYAALRDVIDHVVPDYRYTSLDELNAVLRLYNAEAYAGQPGSALREHGGLIYRVLDDDGKAVSSSIKASLFESKPTLKNLEQRFSENEELREGQRERITAAIDWAFAGTELSPGEFTAEMEKVGVSVVYRHGKDGSLSNVWYVDHVEKTVYSGDALGGNFSARGLAARCITDEAWEERQRLSQEEREGQHLRMSHF